MMARAVFTLLLVHCIFYQSFVVESARHHPKSLKSSSDEFIVLLDHPRNIHYGQNNLRATPIKRHHRHHKNHNVGKRAFDRYDHGGLIYFSMDSIDEADYRSYYETVDRPASEKRTFLDKLLSGYY